MAEKRKNPKLSEALKRKWASGTRKPTPRSAYEKASRTHRAKVAAGTFKTRTMTREQALEYASHRDMDAVREQCRKLGLLWAGKKMPGRAAASEDHWKARYWKLRAPTGRIVQGWNLNELVRRHSDLFNPDDLNWRNHYCRATKGLRQLFETDERGWTTVHSWKGWTALMVNDEGEPAHDL